MFVSNLIIEALFITNFFSIYFENLCHAYKRWTFKRKRISKNSMLWSVHILRRWQFLRWKYIVWFPNVWLREGNMKKCPSIFWNLISLKNATHDCTFTEISSVLRVYLTNVHLCCKQWLPYSGDYSVYSLTLYVFMFCRGFEPSYTD